MKFLAQATVLLAALASAPASHAQVAPGSAAESRQATRCAIYYLLMSKVPDATKEKTRLEALVADLGHVAVANGATDGDMDAWTKEYMSEAVANSAVAGSTFNHDQGEVCAAFLAKRANDATAAATAAAAATPAPTPVAETARLLEEEQPPPAPDATAVVKTRHPGGRPATISALDHLVSFDEGAGDTCDAPVVMGDAEDKDSRIRSQYVWLDAVHPGWRLLTHATKYSEQPTKDNVDDVKIYSWFSLQAPDGKHFEVCFDATQGMLPDLKALAQ